MVCKTHKNLQDGKSGVSKFFSVPTIVVILCITNFSVNAELVCHYKFDGNLLDSSVNAYPAGNGTLYGNTLYVTGKFGQALSFDGAGDYIKIMVASNGSSGWTPRTKISNAITIAMWVKMNSYPADAADFIASRSWQPGDNNFEFHQGGFGMDTPFFVVQQGIFMTEFPHKKITSDKLGKWFHIAVTYDVVAGESYMYIDGVAGNVAPITSGAWVTIGNYSIGGNEALNSRYFKGQIDDLRIYNHALSPAEIQTVYNEEVDLCGSQGYLQSDLNRDCYVGFKDIISIAKDWLKNTKSDSNSDSLPVPGTVLYPANQDIPTYEAGIRETFSLAGKWKLMTENPIRMYNVNVPGVWQNQGPGMAFHGVGAYQKTFDFPSVPQGKRLWLHFENVATKADVFLNGQNLGSHLGAWTPFEFDITEIVQNSNSLQVRVDEKLGHFTAGFLPVVAGSFGGIWGDVWIEARPESFLKDAFVTPEIATSTAKLNINISNSASLPQGAKIEAKAFSIPDNVLAGTATINASNLNDGIGLIAVALSNQKLWSPEQPNLYNMEIRILDSQNAIIDQDVLKFGMREFKVQGSKLVLNGSPIYIASALHWGIYPQYLAPSCTKEEFRQEVLKLKELGFNAVNVCLFMFPERYYEVADEEGLILWQEYPFWNNFANAPRPQTQAEKAAFVEEYKEMFIRDRRHVSVSMRSITLEDHNMDVELIGGLYHLAHQMIPGAVVQDNSTELHQVNEIADWVDHHPYVEVNAWKSEMASWMNKVNTTYGGKPFLFGEAFDFDTFRDVKGILAHYGEERPWWTILEHATGIASVPGNFGSGDFWGHEMKTERLENELGAEGLAKIKNDSYKHSMACRKYECEQSRLYDGFAGLSITCIRDNKVTRPGLYDDIGNLKFPKEDLKRFNAQTIPLIDTNRQSRCYKSGESINVKCYVSHYEPFNIANGILNFELLSSDASKVFSNVNINKGSVVKVGEWDFSAPQVTTPTQFELKATLNYGEKVLVNSWPVWIYPAKGTGISENITIYDPQGKLSTLNIGGITATQQVMITSVLNSTVINHLNSGGKAVLIDVSATAFASHDTPFWREVAVERYSQELFSTFPWDGFVNLQFFDMTSYKGYNTDVNNTPMLRTINCRWLGQNDVIIKRNYGNGLLIATTLNLCGQNNAAGQNLLENILTYLCQ
ncbi:MAG: hypothetical protein A2Y10_16890 [Planctomycetes bacterium GWF2_41_51]|nr:MAG: hypothetical protein A2Y10_16890 [Planctomycetes bacterium GWF2_41_51]HBG28093.1 hypothetical protein [Phycisphaerales bacterium]